MKRIIWILFAIGVLFSCEKKEEITYYFHVNGISKDSVVIGDTMDIYIDWENSLITEEVNIYSEETPCVSLGLQNDTTFRIIIPKDILDRNCLYLYHPNGSDATFCTYFKKDNPKIASVSPLIGKGGDIITITGIDFSTGDSIGLKINSMHCERVSFSDTLMKFKVPEGCGNGKIKVLYWPDYNYCNPEKSIEVGIFEYQFEAMPASSLVKNYYEYGIEYGEFERDVQGRIIKRKLIREYSTILENTYEILSYGDNGLIDSIKLYSNEELLSYTLYQRNSNNTIIETSTYRTKTGFYEKFEHHYLDGKLIQLNWYLNYPEGIRHMFRNQYTYEDDKLVCIRDNYDINGELESQWKYNYVLDIFNGTFPDVGIPGYGIRDIYPDLTYGYRYSTIKYDEYGRLKYWKYTTSYCQKQDTTIYRTYEYE
jgi:hypothetical protein